MTADTIRVDLHVHSVHSPDSATSVEALVGHLPYTGLRGFALTDHNSVRGHATLAQLRERHPSYWFLPGVEVSALEGHVLAYGVAEAPPPGRPAAETVEWVRAHGGEAVLAHPFRWSHGVGRVVAGTVAVSSLEARNGHNSEMANLRAEALAARRGLGMTGGSDAHTTPDLGRAFTEFEGSVASLDDLLEAIRRRRVAAGGRSLTWPGRIRLAMRAGLLRVSRGFRPV